MRLGTLLSSLSTAGIALAQSVTNTTDVNTLSTGNSTIIPKRFILELAPGSSLSALVAELGTLNGTSVSKVYDSPVFSGVSIVSTGGNVDTLQSMSHAGTAWPAKRISRGNVTVQDASSSSGPLRSRDTVNPAQAIANSMNSQNYSIHTATGVDGLHAAGIKGKGAQIAAIDTGVQYTQPGLGGCFGPGCRVGGGYDLVGDGCWPTIGCLKAPDSDPMDYDGPGTLCAGILIGADDADGFYGVAPEATLYSYKVFADQFDTDEETLIEAMLMAYDDGADVIFMDILYQLASFADDAFSVVASRMVDQGVVVAGGAGGDSDSDGPSTTGPYLSPVGAAGNKVLGVSALYNVQQALDAFEFTIELDGYTGSAVVAFSYEWYPLTYESDGLPIVPVTLDTNVAADACEPLEQDFTGVIALVRMGGCDTYTKQTNLVAANATAIIFYWDPSSYGQTAPVTRFGCFAITISDVAGEGMVNAILAGGNVSGNYSSVYTRAWSNPAGNIAVLYDGWGPLSDLTIKPDIAAPGDRLETTILNQAEWGLATGTSLSAAYVAGIAALYIGQHGGRKTNPSFNASNLAMRIMSSGSALPFLNFTSGNTTSFNAPVFQVGTGLVNATRVLEYSTQLSYAKFHLNDTHNFERYQKVDITNNAAVDVTYTFAWLPAAGFETWLPSEGRVVVADEAIPIDINPVVSLPSGTFKVAAGKTKTAQVNFSPPTYQGYLPLYSGLIQINSSLGESFSVPYLGLAARLDTFFSGIFASGYPHIVSGPQSVDSSVDSSWSFNLAVNKQDYPKLSVRTQWASEELRWDIYDSGFTAKNWVYPPVAGSNHYVGSATYWSGSEQAILYDPGSALSAGNNTAFPIDGLPRFDPSDPDAKYWWFGQLANGTQIAPGKYIMQVAVLMPFGDRTKAAGWDTWTLPFTVV